MKPSHTPATTAIFPILVATSMAAANTSGVVALADLHDDPLRRGQLAAGVLGLERPPYGLADRAQLKLDRVRERIDV